MCVRETHGAGEPVNELVALPADGDGEPRVLASGRDFYAFPRAQPRRRHAGLDDAGTTRTCRGTARSSGRRRSPRPIEARLVAGGPSESIWQPEWSPEGVLHFVSDRDNWWNLYRDGEQLTHEKAELGYPQWGFGGSSYAFLESGDIVCVRVDRGYERLCILRAGSDRLEDLGLPYTAVGYPQVRSQGDRVVYVALSADRGGGRRDLGSRGRGGEGRVGRGRGHARPGVGARAAARSSSRAPAGAPRTPSGTRPRARTTRRRRASCPPIIVQIHGGPTAHAIPMLDPEIAFWTSRGIGVVDVNYGGSTGFGREYRGC